MRRMKTTTSSAGFEQAPRRTIRKDRRIFWAVYLLVAVSLFVLWFVAGSVMLSYLFGGWMMIGAIALWLIEDTAEY